MLKYWFYTLTPTNIVYLAIFLYGYNIDVILCV